jgi:hypothetical protein
MGGGVMSMIASAHASRHRKNVYKIANLDYPPLKIYLA